MKVSTDDVLIDQLEKLGSVVVTGLAGSGKSMFMKFMTIWYFDHTREITPLFFELRQLNSLTEKDILTTIRNACASKMHAITENQFHMGLMAGAFLLVLDGFDELNHDIRENIQGQILKIKKDFPKTPIVLSSPPDERFGAWTAFHVYKVNDLTQAQTTKLIENLPYDEEVKKRFLKEVAARLYESHSSFLSSPLLATIMLLTFESFAKIPVKIHAFYGQAFDTLFQKHDAQKEQFQRKTYTGLELEDFKDCFSAFCAISYLQEKFSFTKDALDEISGSAVKYYEQSRKVVKGRKSKQITHENLISDLQHSFCMLQQDGLEKSFVHRSFQEYFAARFVTKLHSSKIKAILDNYCLRTADSVLPMLHDMYREPVETEWVIPTINTISQYMNFDVAEAKPSIALKKLFPSISIRCFALDTVSLSIPITERAILSRILAISKLYSQLGENFFARHLTNKSLPDLKKALSDERYIGLKSQSQFASLFSSKTSNQQRMVGITFKQIAEEDDWWMAEIGLGKMVSELHRSLTSIQRDIEGRARKRESILSEFI